MGNADVRHDKEQRAVENTEGKSQFTINWDRVKFVHGEPIFTDQHKPATKTSQVLFKTHFSNSTAMEQEYSFKTERTTSSTCEVSVERAVTTGAELNLHLKTPCEVFEAHGGFKREVTLTKSQGETIEEVLTWSVDSIIKVPPRHRTTAELVIYEDEFEGAFNMRTDFSGRILVRVTNTRDNNSFVKLIEGDLDQIVHRELNNGLRGFTVENGIVTYNTSGRCHFRYGIEQHVQITQQPL